MPFFPSVWINCLTCLYITCKFPRRFGKKWIQTKILQTSIQKRRAITNTCFIRDYFKFPTINKGTKKKKKNPWSTSCRLTYNDVTSRSLSKVVFWMKELVWMVVFGVKFHKVYFGCCHLCCKCRYRYLNFVYFFPI